VQKCAWVASAIVLVAIDYSDGEGNGAIHEGRVVLALCVVLARRIQSMHY
jgi:hypothetical protein